MKPIVSDELDASYRPHPEEVTRSKLRVTVSKDGRGERRLWPSHSASKTRVNALIETARAEEARASSEFVSLFDFFGFWPRK
jgi:hypothetical protein